MSVREKASRITEVRGPVSDVSEVRRRFPEVDAIIDDEVRESTIDYLIRGTPAYFWEKPASVSGEYHPPDERGKHGLWLHSKRVFAVYANLSESFAEMGLITEWERDCGKAAALIHDTFQGGWPSDNGDWSTSHDVIAAGVANYLVGMPEEVVHLVHAHMGPWGDGKEPETENELLFHLSDKSAADSNHTPSVYHPAEELLDSCPELNSIDTEDVQYI
jgi:hypothetical protein